MMNKVVSNYTQPARHWYYFNPSILWFYVYAGKVGVTLYNIFVVLPHNSFKSPGCLLHRLLKTILTGDFFRVVGMVIVPSRTLLSNQHHPSYDNAEQGTGHNRHSSRRHSAQLAQQQATGQNFIPGYLAQLDKILETSFGVQFRDAAMDFTTTTAVSSAAATAMLIDAPGKHQWHAIHWLLFSLVIGCFSLLLLVASLPALVLLK